MHPVVFLLGPHGCGKTSVGRALESSHGFKHISIGDLGRLARQRKTTADFSLRLMCMLAGHMPDQQLRPAIVEELLKNVSTLRMRSAVSIDGFPSEPDHLRLIPPDSRIIYLNVPEDVRNQRLLTRSLNGPRKWTPGAHSVRDAGLPALLEAGAARIVDIDAASELSSVMMKVIAKI